MIDHAQRAYASEVLKSGRPHDAAHPKANAYGITARVLASFDLRYLAECVATSGLQTTDHVTNRISSCLAVVSEQALSVRAVRAAVFSSVEQLDASRGDGADADGGYDETILHSGIQTAATAEAITLRTIKDRLRSGQTVTRRGIDASQRVPFKLAMLHLAQIDLERHESLERKEWLNGEEGLVLNQTAAPMTPTQGLVLHAEFPMVTRRTSVLASEPHIGCPATLIPGFIRTLHAMTADLALANSVIQASD